MADNIKNINAAAIDEVEFPTCVRLRRGMYISNRNQMVTEIIDNSIDEHFAGYCNTIAVIIAVISTYLLGNKAVNKLKGE